MGAFGFDAAIEMAGQDANKHKSVFGQADVVVGSVQSLQDNRLMRWDPRSFGLIIIDECHRAMTPMYTKMLNWFEGYHLLGITATPRRGDDRNLGSRFQVKAFEFPLRQAIKEQYLAPVTTRTCKVPIDLRGIKMSGGDFAIGDLEERIMPKLEQLARAFLKECGDRPAVAFLPDVASSNAFAQMLCEVSGQPIARYVAGTQGEFGMSKAERNTNLEAFEQKVYQIVVCCELLIEGWDCPHVEVCGIVRPTLQQYRYAQMVGRALRPSPATGKTSALVIDFDWETEDGAKDLCSTVDLFDDESLDKEVYAVARELERAAGDQEIKAEELIDEAERIVRTRNKLMIRLTGKEAKYEALTFDPVGVGKILDLGLKPKYDLDRRGTNPASERQLQFLASLGVTAPESLSKWGASKMLDKLMKRKKEGLAGMADVQRLLSAGVNPDIARIMSSKDAAQAIRDIEATKPKTQGRMF